MGAIAPRNYEILLHDVTLPFTRNRSYSYLEFKDEIDAEGFALYWFAIVIDSEGKVIHDFQTKLPFDL